MSDLIPHQDLTTVELYASRRHVYTRAFSGFYRNVRRSLGAVLLLIYFALPWLSWDGRQAVWWDLPSRRFYLLGSTFWPQDFILLSGLLIVAAFGLFFITVYAGRVWCGYACPQSVWTWLFMWCEKVTEGDRSQRIRLDQAAWSAGKLGRKSLKHLLWGWLALATALTFVGYFTPIRTLVGTFFSGQADAWSYVWVGLLSLATYGNAGWLREQVCIHMCPYGRFQSVMLDQDSLIVSYNPQRGEPRGPRRREADPLASGLGDCIDCTMCVQVCPTGIDIRDGLQIECIGCAACVDACDSIMDKMNYPRGLVGYTTAHQLDGGATRTWRPRLVGYAWVLALMVAALGTAFATRPLSALDVSKDRILYRENAAGRLENVYTLKIINKSQRPQLYRLAAEGPQDLHWEGRREVPVDPGQIASLVVQLSLPADPPPVSVQTVTFSLIDGEGTRIEAQSRFTGPSLRPGGPHAR
jgi:cytochrome c oxidase accessory protein FixG